MFKLLYQFVTSGEAVLAVLTLILLPTRIKQQYAMTNRARRTGQVAEGFALIGR
jgi:hypothetical protein